jgi:hypothetical protein
VTRGRPRIWFRFGCLGCSIPLVIVLVLAVVFVRIHGWNDISVGTDTAYCGMHFQRGQHPFYCQSGH